MPIKYRFGSFVDSQNTLINHLAKVCGSVLWQRRCLNEKILKNYFKTDMYGAGIYMFYSLWQSGK